MEILLGDLSKYLSYKKNSILPPASAIQDSKWELVNFFHDGRGDASVSGLKWPSHDKLKVANSCWQTQVGVCARHNNSEQVGQLLVRIETSSILSPTVANLSAVVHTQQLQFANTS